MTSMPRALRADLHVHTYHSGYAGHLRFLHARDCYSEPEAVYRTAKARGMDVVTFTDHDRIDGCLEFLDRHPDASDFFISEEIECRMPDNGLRVHIGAYGLTERIHRDVQPLRANVFEAAAFLRAEGVFCAFNHPFFFLNRQLSAGDYLAAMLPLFDAVEVRNGTMLPAHNDLVERIVGSRVVTIGGSDSHTLSGVATTYTEVPGSTREEFLANLRAGLARPGGRHGSMWRVAREIYGVVGCYWASLVGIGRQELSPSRRFLGLAFSAISLPGEFVPLLVAAIDKRAEARRVAQYERELFSTGAGLPAIEAASERAS